MVSNTFYGNLSRWGEGGGVVFELWKTAAKGRFKQFWNSTLNKGVIKRAFCHQGVAFFWNN